MQDEEIIALYWQRDERAITETSVQYGAYCYKIADHILNNDADVEECINDTWLKTWNAIPDQRPSRFSAFLAKITRNLALDRWNYETAKKRGGCAAVIALDELEECIAGASNPEKEYEATQLVSDINRFLKLLPEREQSIFMLRYFYVESVACIAKKHGISENNVSAILSRTRKKLKKYLLKEGYLL